MFWWDHERVEGWLGQKGLRRDGPGSWRDEKNGATLSSRDVAFQVIEDALESEQLIESERLALGFGLLDLLDEYAVAMYLGFEFVGRSAQSSSKIALVWEFCKHILERSEESNAVPYWLWVDWFEDESRADEAFKEMIGVLPASLLVQPGLRRVARVLRFSGPVPWASKRDALRYAARHRELHSSLLWAIQGAVEDVFGQVVVPEARGLLKRLRVSGDDAELKTRLTGLLNRAR